ncbi:MAG: hypothetical protein SFY32_06875 [Bacteroidota bacterium]|nr:hypothetical protein [Bacteroidota bacterium]
MNLELNSNNFFKKWEDISEEYVSKIVKDGIINTSEYKVISPKILFICKEPNDPEQNPGDFREWWKEGAFGSFSYRISEWAFGLINNFPPFSEISKSNAYDSYLQKIALINIKKIGGTGNANHSEIMKHFLVSKELLKKQIQIINPEIIVLCLSFNYEIRQELFGFDFENCGYNIEVGKYENYRIIDFYHPSSRNAPPAAYSLLQNVYKSEMFNELKNSFKN